MTNEDVAIIGVFNSERFERLTELIYANMLAERATLDDAQICMNLAMNAAYLYARNFEVGKKRHITERCLNAEMQRQEDDDEFANPAEE